MRRALAVFALAVLSLLGPVAGQTSGINGRNLINGSVPLSKLATQASGTLLGNNSGSAASPSALTSAQAKTLLGLGISDVSGLQSALDGKLALSGGTVTGTLVLNNGANSLRLTAGSVDHAYVEFYARTASPNTQSGYFGYPGAGSSDLYFANSLSGGNIVLNTTGGGKLYTNGNTLIDASDQRILYYGGLLSSRPAAISANAGLWYFATDVNGGTLYRSTGAAWQQVAPGLGTFSASAAGLVPASGGGTTTFLRADGTWAAPPAGGIGSVTTAGLPACASGNKGAVYFVSDANSGLGNLALCDGTNYQYPSLGQVALTGYTSLAGALAVTTANRQRLIIPPGTYTLSTPVTLSDYTDLECLAGATFQPGTPTNTVLLIQASRLRLRGCAVDTSNLSYTGIAVDVQGNTDAGDRYAFNVDGLYINSNFTQQGTCLRLYSAGAGATSRWVSQTRWNNVSCRGFATGLLLQTTGGIANDYVNGNVFSNFFATANTVQIKVDARADAEVSRNVFSNFNLQTGSTTSRSITLSGKAQANRFDGVTWDWGGANSGVSGKLAYEVTGSGNSYAGPMFNRISDLGFGWDANNLSIAPRNYFLTQGNTSSPVENQISLPGSDENRAMVGDQDDILAGATFRYAVTTVSQSVAPTCRGGSLATLFAPHGKCTWNMPAGGGSVTLRIDLNPDGNGYDYIDTIGAQYINAGEQPSGVTIAVGDTSPALTTAYTTSNNLAMYTLAQNIGIGGSWQVRYIDYTFSRASAGNLSVQRLFARGLIREGPFWPLGPNGGVLWNNGNLHQATPLGNNGDVLTSSGSASGPQFSAPKTVLQNARASAEGQLERILPAFNFDFITQGISGSLTNAAISSGTVTSPASGVTTSNHPGVVLLRSSTTANSGYQYTSKLDAFLLGGGENLEAVFWVPASLTNSTVRIGFLDTNTSSDAVDGVYLEIPGSTAAVCKTSNSSTRSTSPTVATLSTSTWYHLIISVASTTSATCSLYNDAGTLLGSQTLTTNIPSTAGRETGFGVVATNSGTTATDLIAMDYIGYWYSTARLRGQ